VERSSAHFLMNNSLQGRRVGGLGSIDRLWLVGRLRLAGVVVIVVVLTVSAILVVPLQLGLEGVVLEGEVLLPVVGGGAPSVAPLVHLVGRYIDVLEIVACSIVSILARPREAQWPLGRSGRSADGSVREGEG